MGREMGLKRGKEEEVEKGGKEMREEVDASKRNDFEPSLLLVHTVWSHI